MRRYVVGLFLFQFDCYYYLSSFVSTFNNFFVAFNFPRVFEAFSILLFIIIIFINGFDTCNASPFSVLIQSNESQQISTECNPIP